MSIYTVDGPYAYPREKMHFRHGRPVPGTEFAEWVEKEKRLGVDGIHPSKSELQDDSVLRLSGHSSQQLLNRLLADFQQPKGRLSLLQSQGVAQYKRECSFLFSEEDMIALDSVWVPESEKLMTNFYQAFDKLFFRGCLDRLCKIKFCSTKGMELPGDYGFCNSPDNVQESRKMIPDDYLSLISIRRFSDPGMLVKDRLKSYLATLLHEMLHAYFGIYVCLCDACACSRVLTLGESSHGFVWQKAALHLEERSLEYLGLEADLGRWVSWTWEEESYKQKFVEMEITEFKF